MVHFNGPQTKYIGDSLYKHPRCTENDIFCEYESNIYDKHETVQGYA